MRASFLRLAVRNTCVWGGGVGNSGHGHFEHQELECPVLFEAHKCERCGVTL